MSAEIGWATLGIIPSFRGFSTALDRGTSKAMLTAGATGGTTFGNAAGKSAGARFGSTFKTAAKVGMAGLGAAAFGAGAFIKDAVDLEAAYGKTFAQIRVATGVPLDQIKRLDDLAIKLGKDTVFSANESADAMLELAKNGITPATIEAGALKSALILATAGGVDLEDAATTMGNALNAFRLKGKQSRAVAAALAGAANASSASVGSLAEGLQQSSATAADAGLSVQETTGILAAFANAGISGSDAGTSLKTMLSRLVPQTDKATNAMKDLGIDFTKANGEFVNAATIASELHDGLSKLSAEERSTALNTMFGSDARRAATVLMREGEDGLRKYIKATSDVGAAEDMAKANMEGTAGAIEKLKGSWETTKLEFGKAIAPVAVDFMDSLAGKLDDIAPKLAKFGRWFTDEGAPKIKSFARENLPTLKNALVTVKDAAQDAWPYVKDLIDAFNSLPDGVKKAIVIGAGAGAVGKKMGLLGGGSLLGSGLKSLTSKAMPIYTFETNPAMLGGGGIPGAGGKPGGKPGGGLANTATKNKGWLSFLTGLPLPALGALGADQGTHIPLELSAGDIQELHRAGFWLNEATGQWEKAYNLAFDGFKTSLGSMDRSIDLVGAKKINPDLRIPNILQEQNRLNSLGDKLDLVGKKKIRPQIDVSGIDRAQARADRLNDTLSNLATAASSGLDAAAQTVVGAVAGGHRQRQRHLGGMP